MDESRAKRIRLDAVSESYRFIDDPEYQEGLGITLNDEYADSPDNAVVFTVMHTWGDSMVTLGMTMIDEDGRPLGMAVRQVTVAALVEFSERVLHAFQRRNTGAEPSKA